MPNPLKAVRGHTILTHLELIVDPVGWGADLRLWLASEEAPGSSIVEVVFEGVAELSLRDFGGGLTQLLHLEAEDRRWEQLDRVTYRVRETERDSLSLTCRGIRVAAINPISEKAPIA